MAKQRRRPKKQTKAGNTVSVQITLRELVGSSQFGRGYREAKAGKPFNDSGIRGDMVWHYERGRQFACIYDGPIKDGRRVLLPALYAVSEAFRSGSLI